MRQWNQVDLTHQGLHFGRLFLENTLAELVYVDATAHI